MTDIRTAASPLAVGESLITPAVLELVGNLPGKFDSAVG